MLRAAWPSFLPKLVRPWGTVRERKGWQVGEGSRLLLVRPCLLRAADLLWKNGRMNTCNLRSFFPGSQPDYHQPICPAELSGDMNSLLNNFLVQKQTQKGCVWGGGLSWSLSQFIIWLQKTNRELVKASPSLVHEVSALFFYQDTRLLGLANIRKVPGVRGALESRGRWH